MTTARAKLRIYQKVSACEDSCTCGSIPYCWTRTVCRTRDSQGTKIIRYIGEKITHEESERRLATGNAYIFGLDERSALDGSTPKNTARYINHSCEPNCHTEQFGNTIWIVAIKDITAGEELTYNYEYSIDDEPPEPCHCGAKHCCGYILGPQYWDRVKQLARQ